MKGLLCVLSFILLSSVDSSAQVYNSPVFDRSDVPSFRVEKVEVTKDTTYVHCLYSASSGSWASLSSGTFLYDRITKKKYPLLRCDGLPYSPRKKTFMYDEHCKVLLCFQSVKRISRIDLIEDESDKAFNIYGIDISAQYETSYQESEVNRFNNMASFYDSAGDTIKALQFKEKEIEATKYVYGIKSEPLIVSFQNASIMYDKYGYYEQAISIAKQEGLLYAELWGTTDWNYALYLSSLGQLYSHAGKYDLAVREFEKSIKLFESIHFTDNAYALALYFAADNYYELGDIEKALICQKKCIQVRRKMGDSDGYINLKVG